jgi:hypothetical protein
MKNNDKEMVTIDIGKEGMNKLSKMISMGQDFAEKFCENPISFCETNKFKIYNGYSMDLKRGKTYVLVNKIDNNNFAIIWLYLNDTITSIVVDEDVLNNYIKEYDFLRIDNEIFNIWLNDNSEEIKNTWKKRMERYEEFISRQKNGT